MTCQQPTSKQGANACVMGVHIIRDIAPVITMGVFSLWIDGIKEELKMSVEKLKNYEASVVAKRMIGLFLKEGEKRRLYDICIKYGIPITYPSLFADDTHYYLWGISKNGIGLVGTVVMNGLEANNGKIFESLDELEEYLKGNK